jgi:hypothetical protein
VTRNQLEGTMSRVKRYGGRLQNEVVRRLESGNGNVKGLKLLVPVEDSALVPVTVVGISFGTYAKDGVAVLVKPVGGSGSMSVAATELIDDSKAAREDYRRRGEAAEYLRDNTPKDSASDKVWRSAVSGERALMSDAQRKAFDELAPKWFREKQTMIDGIKQANSWDLKRILPAAVAIRFGVDEVLSDY